MIGYNEFDKFVSKQRSPVFHTLLEIGASGSNAFSVARFARRDVLGTDEVWEAYDALRVSGYFGVAGAAGAVEGGGAGVLTVAGPDTRRFLVACGNLSAFAQSKLTCHI